MAIIPGARLLGLACDCQGLCGQDFHGCLTCNCRRPQVTAKIAETCTIPPNIASQDKKPRQIPPWTCVERGRNPALFDTASTPKWGGCYCATPMSRWTYGLVRFT
jgi:hypothetical protein